MEFVQAYAKSHGGNIELVGLTEDNDVLVRFKGTCAYCPMADVTLKLGIEKEIRSQVPGIRRIRQV